MRYLIEFIDDGGRVYSSETLDTSGDAEAISIARRIFTSGIGHGFDIHCDGRLVHRELVNQATERRAGKPAEYTACFFNAVGTLTGRLEIAADSDDEAQDIAAVLYDACSDTCSYYELWKGEKAVRKAQYFMLAPTAEELSERTQQQVIDRELAIRDSKWHISESRRLIEQLQEWNSEVRARR